MLRGHLPPFTKWPKSRPDSGPDWLICFCLSTMEGAGRFVPGYNSSKSRPYDAYPVRCRVPDYYAPCSGRVRVCQLKNCRQLKQMAGRMADSGEFGTICTGIVWYMCLCVCACLGFAACASPTPEILTPHPLSQGDPTRILEQQSLQTTRSTLHPTNPSTLHPTPYTIHPTPYTLHPSPYTIHHTPYTLHPTPYSLHYSLHHTPYTSYPIPCTIHPAPYTWHPTPCTLHPAPYALDHAVDPTPQTLNHKSPETLNHNL